MSKIKLRSSVLSIEFIGLALRAIFDNKTTVKVDYEWVTVFWKFSRIIAQGDLLWFMIYLKNNRFVIITNRPKKVYLYKYYMHVFQKCRKLNVTCMVFHVLNLSPAVHWNCSWLRDIKSCCLSSPRIIMKPMSSRPGWTGPTASSPLCPFRIRRELLTANLNILDTF